MKVFIFPGKLEVNDIKRVFDGLKGVDICGIMVRREETWIALRRDYPHVHVWLKHQLDDINTSMPKSSLHDNAYETILRTILSDPTTFCLAERIYRKEGINSVFNSIIKVEILCWNAIAIIAETQPDKVVFQATPHNITTWIFGRVAELLDIPVLFAANTIVLPWRMRVVSGIKEQKPIDSSAQTSCCNLSSKALDHFNRMKCDYSQAMPGYEKKRLERYRGKFWSTKVELSYIFNAGIKLAPFKIINSLRKRHCLSVYNKLARKGKTDQKYILFLPHYQPERTTIPEAGWYIQQWLIVRSLSVSLQKYGWRLAVKEHPSIFRQPWNPGFRSSDFYKAIASLENVDLVPLDSDTFELIDRAEATATVTGTTIFESICRGKPVFVFGPDFHRALCGVMCVGSMEDIDAWLKKIQEKNINISDEAIKEYLSDVESNSFEKDLRINTSIDAYIRAIMHYPV
jgi:hypothetical protein